ncbi:glutenin, high molecular weight subunit PW212-like [Drosophila serrata]|uniref:glutenin, high molecular weight subunit PW212-like n=1 Tax=Drosophila serrata TaxID=7274 RepID=UPI000A1D1161|nr:glutenin, high molecular weight subunit PW212-like [Drosophila serrata]
MSICSVKMYLLEICITLLGVASICGGSRQTELYEGSGGGSFEEAVFGGQEQPGNWNSPGPGQYPGSWNNPRPGQYPGSWNNPRPGQYPGSWNSPGPGQYPGSWNNPRPGQNPGSWSNPRPGQYPVKNSGGTEDTNNFPNKYEIIDLRTRSYPQPYSFGRK